MKFIYKKRETIELGDIIILSGTSSYLVFKEGEYSKLLSLECNEIACFEGKPLYITGDLNNLYNHFNITKVIKSRNIIINELSTKGFNYGKI